MTSISHHPHDPPIECKNLWNIYGANSEKALAAVQADKLGKEECRKRFDCVIGVVDASFSVNEGEYWSVKKRHQTFRHYSDTPNLMELRATTIDYLLLGYRSISLFNQIRTKSSSYGI